MRKSLILMLIATLLVGAFLVSCNSDISSESSNGDKLVKVTIAGNAKGISAVSTSDDADNYYWYYSATKDDSGVYRTGQTSWKAVKANNETGLSGADLGYFSSGDWKFSFYGYTTAQTYKPADPKSSSVYYQEDNAVTVVKTTDTPTYVSVTLKEGSLGETATLVINSMNWKYTPELSTEYSATLANLGENKKATIHFSYLSGTDAYTDITTATGEVKLYTSADAFTTTASDAAYAKADFSFTGNYTIPASIDGKENTIKFWVTIGNETVGDEDTINVVAYSGGVVTLSIDSTGVAVADNEAFNKVIIDENTIGFTAKRSVAVSENKSAAKTIVTKAAPSTESNALTSITFPQGALVTTTTTEDNTTYDVEMDVVVYQTESAASEPKFVITSDSNPSTFAGLDLSVDLIKTVNNEAQTPEPLTTFNNEAVTVTTYIAKNLTGVQVVYTGTGNYGDNQHPSNITYDPDTGALTFTTTHFSEFAVGANEKVYDKTTNTGYTVADFNAIATDIASHEFILLDATVANDIDDSRDVFNAGYRWTAIHKADDRPNTTDFAGGYGTKIEPYMIASTDNMKKISDYYDTYKYYKVSSEITAMDCTDWVSVKLYGSFDGNGVAFNNVKTYLFREIGYTDGNPSNLKNDTIVLKRFTANMNMRNSQSQYSGAAMAFEINNIGTTTFKDVHIHGTLEGNFNVGSFFQYGVYNSVDNYNTDGFDYSVKFDSCSSDARIICPSGNAVGGFLGHPYTGGNRNLTLTITNSSYTGEMYTLTNKTTGLGNVYAAIIYNLDVTDDNVSKTTTTETSGRKQTSVAYDSSKNHPIPINKPTNNGSGSIVVNLQEGSSKLVVSLTAQMTAYDSNNKITNLSGITSTLKNWEINIGDGTSSYNLGEEISQLLTINSVNINLGSESFGYEISNGNLTIKLGTNDNYVTGFVRLQVAQYGSDGFLISSGVSDVCKKENLSDSWTFLLNSN